jgi:putative Holliday junction resolvase
MAILDLPAFKQALPPDDGPLLGLDIGSRTIGLAVSDVRRRIASPLETLRRTKRFKDDAARVVEIVRGHGVVGFVAGWPLEMSGAEGARSQATRQILANVLGAVAAAGLGDRPALLWDERFSSAAVERAMIESADMTRKRRAQVIDRTAAAYILQGALDALNG